MNTLRGHTCSTSEAQTGKYLLVLGRVVLGLFHLRLSVCVHFSLKLSFELF